MGYLTRAAFQREAGKSRAEVDRLLAEGLPHTVSGAGRGCEIRIDRGQAMRWLADRALNGKATPVPPPKPSMPDFPPWVMAIIDSTGTSVEQAWCFGLVSAIYPLPAVTAAVAIRSGCGLTMTQAYELSGAVTATLVDQTFTDARRAGVEPFASAGEDGPEILDPEAFWPIDWRQLAKEAGEPGWVPPRCNHLWPAPEAHDGTA